MWHLKIFVFLFAGSQLLSCTVTETTTTRLFSEPNINQRSRSFIFQRLLKARNSVCSWFRFAERRRRRRRCLFFLLLKAAVCLSAKGTNCSLSQGSSNYYQLWASALYNSPVGNLSIAISCQSLFSKIKKRASGFQKCCIIKAETNVLKPVFFLTDTSLYLL